MKICAALFLAILTFAPVAFANPGNLLSPVSLNSGWRLQDIARVSGNGPTLSAPGYQPSGWYKATVPGTALTSLVDDGVYPDPLYGENNRPDKIPESLCRTSYWYQNQFKVPSTYGGKHIWLRFDGINYAAEVWVNGHDAGAIKGAFTRGLFEITPYVTAGESASVAVLIQPQPHPGTVLEQTQENGTGPNGGQTAEDGPTFLATVGWDWMPGIRDRDTGIWQGVTLLATGPVVVENPVVISDLPLPRTDSADLTVSATVHNISDYLQKGLLVGDAGAGIQFQTPVSLAPGESKTITLTPANAPALHVLNPRLWWPNGYGAPNLYTLHLSFNRSSGVSDAQDITFGIRKITYFQPGSDTLSLSVNGVPIFCKGGDWGMDEGMKHIDAKRLAAQIRMHRLANYTMIRNWVGQSTSEEFYEACDKYGILVWDEFFQPNPSDGPNPDDINLYLANVKDTILRFRNHPCVALWCGRNEGDPTPAIDSGIRKLLSDLDPDRFYQSSSGGGHGVQSGGPYHWRAPRFFYISHVPFSTEIGTVSIPTIESIHAMMPQKDWDTVNDDWAEHDFCSGAQDGSHYPFVLAARYGWVTDTNDFARKAQLMNYEAFRAMYESRNAKLFNPATGLFTWMSNPAQPSFVWQIYSHDLEPFSSLYAVRHACEPIHIQMDQDNGQIMVINNTPKALTGLTVKTEVLALDAMVLSSHSSVVSAGPSAATTVGAVSSDGMPPVYFVKLWLTSAQGQLLSDNFYWQARPDNEDDFQQLDTLPMASLTAQAKRRDAGGKLRIEVTLTNPTKTIALAAHIQLRGAHSNQRILPVFYSNNYVSLLPGESKTISVEAAKDDLGKEAPLVVVDGYNVTVQPVKDGGVMIAPNPEGTRSATPHELFINCGGPWAGPYGGDFFFTGGSSETTYSPVDTSAPYAAPMVVYQSGRRAGCTYAIPVSQGPHTVRLHFVENDFDHAGARKFDVEINGQRVLTDFDIFAEAGGVHKALVKDFTGISPDTTGVIRIDFKDGTADLPIISAIQIL